MSDAGGSPKPPDPGYGPTMLVGLLAAAAATVAASRPWLSATATVDGLPTLTATVSGAAQSPLAGALGVVMLAAFGAVVATRGGVRRALGLLVVAAAVTIFIAATAPSNSAGLVEAGLMAKGWSGGAYNMDTVFWRWVSAAAALICAGAGVAVAAWGGEWATMGSRYDAPAGADASRSDAPGGAHRRAEELSEAEVWREIDRGHDPTETP